MSDVAPDGSPVAFYRRVPAMGEPELIHAAIPAGATVLDLGCGPGRIAVPLVALGHAVTGVDNGPAMIQALPPGVEGVLADATTVRLGRRFDAVLLASHLVDDPDHGPAFAATARAHVADDGLVIGETYPPGWDAAVGVSTVSRMGDATVELVEASVDGSFTARLLDEEALIRLLADAGLAFDGWLDRPGWFRARPA